MSRSFMAALMASPASPKPAEGWTMPAASNAPAKAGG
eukprot:CAMPEP_0118885198 /NCGR_PEP_ID=MMETSP1163-20130328/23769_1 /TAXON_ID=124430 /ORGANISM="Phaeomonas parva, Strain CCMP2877" /LENGTH=36 /DNA_ID= /DNA_START= /DNA_END= /DNA_ORIENTATION=